jgi:hypothetical protein
MSALPTLYELDDDLTELEGTLDDPDLTDEAKQEFVATWLKCMEKVGEKLDGYAALIRTLKARALVFKVEEDEFKAKRRTAENAVERLESNLLGFMQGNGWDKYPTKRFEIRVCANGGKAPVVVLCEPGDLPESYRRVTVEPDKEAIRTALEAGEKVEGCAIGERGRYLRVV